MRSEGTFTKEWQKYATNDEAWAGLQGREVEVKDVITVRVRRYGTAETRETHVYNLELLP
nr:MAG TPA: hypothetical protein [Bacteriophage sp.]